MTVPFKGRKRRFVLNHHIFIASVTLFHFCTQARFTPTISRRFRVKYHGCGLFPTFCLCLGILTNMILIHSTDVYDARSLPICERRRRNRTPRVLDAKDLWSVRPFSVQ
ncbi:hypothetical protein HD554DRAFT_2077334 [Boletus coccyginus]|nr:hypothetical protein HD554DRAFT_2077334 [Boletus coccyginus]